MVNEHTTNAIQTATSEINEHNESRASQIIAEIREVTTETERALS